MAAAICGVLGAGKQSLEVARNALAGRGSTCVEWAQGNVAFAGRHDDGESPLCIDRDAGLVAVADARIDDRDALCDTLGVPRTQRARIADVELILRAFAKWGRDCPRHLLGDYAFCVWSTTKRALFCARDHIGARPFHYAAENGRFVFASAVEAVLAAPGVPDTLDETMIATHLGSTMVSDARTCFQAVRKLPPGHALTVEAGRPESRIGTPRLERHWFPEHAPRAPRASDDAYAERCLELYQRSVRDRLRGGPIGVHVSGGLDSSSVAVLAARELRSQGRPPPPAFTWLPDLGGEPPQPAHAQEYALVDAVCAQEGLPTCHGALTPENVLDLLRLDGALSNVLVHVNEEVVQRHARGRGVRVLLSGWGGDECVSFSGRGYWPQLLLRGRWRKLAAECRAQDAPAWRFLGGLGLELLHPSLPLWLRWLRKGGRNPARRWLAHPGFARRTKPLAASSRRAIGVRSTQLGLLRAGHLAQRMEGWAASGAPRGIEYRYPLLDRRLLEFVLGLPPEQFVRGKERRWLMRNALRSVLPPEVCWHRSKLDPARCEAMVDAFCAALPAIRARFAAWTPRRAGYVDMRVLGKCLADPAEFRARPGPVIRALNFLDFSPCEPSSRAMHSLPSAPSAPPL